jgi:hypothetical protein
MCLNSHGNTKFLLLTIFTYGETKNIRRLDKSKGRERPGLNWNATDLQAQGAITIEQVLSCNPILFAICTITFSTLCKHVYIAMQKNAQ